MESRDISPIVAEVAKGYHYHKPPDFLLYYQDLIEKIFRFIADLLSNLRIVLPGSADTHMVGNLMQLIWFGAGILAIAGFICLPSEG